MNTNLEIVKIEVADVITTSTPAGPSGPPYIPCRMGGAPIEE